MAISASILSPWRRPPHALHSTGGNSVSKGGWTVHKLLRHLAKHLSREQLKILNGLITEFEAVVAAQQRGELTARQADRRFNRIIVAIDCVVHPLDLSAVQTPAAAERDEQAVPSPNDV